MSQERSIIDELHLQPERFSFFQAVRLMHLRAWQSEMESGGKPLQVVGEDGPSDREIVRFGAHVSHRFPGSEIVSLNQDEPDPIDEDAQPVPKMTVSFLGMIGPMGVLPHHYTQLAIDRIRHKDRAFVDFLDLFHHRVLSFFYRAWEKYRFPVAYERTQLDPTRQSRFTLTDCLNGLIGRATAGHLDRLAIPDEVFLHYCGLFAQHPRNAASLSALIGDYFEVPTEVLQFVGQWLMLRTEDQTTMPLGDEGGLGNNVLGESALVGDRVWGVENSFRIRIGPLTYRDFCRFLPDGDQLLALAQLVRSFVGPEFDFDVQPVLLAHEVPQCQVGGEDSSRLGWNSWVSATPFTEDAYDAVFVHEGNPLGNS